MLPRAAAAIRAGQAPPPTRRGEERQEMQRGEQDHTFCALVSQRVIENGDVDTASEDSYADKSR